MAANVDRSTRPSRASAADVISFEKAGKSRIRRDGTSSAGAGANWLDGQVLDLTCELALGRARGLGRPMTEQAQAHELDNGVNGPAKRAFDITVATLALGVFAPLLVLIAVIIALDSRGPVFFRQFRHGRNRRPFKIYKFRTMKADGEEVVLQAKAGDARITRFGAFLRRTSLDELPQLFNVLLGQMSIVGPRPHAVRHDLVFERHLPDYHLRFRCKPGIIGLAQLNGARGEIRSRRDIVRRTKLDLLYQRKWAFLLDLRLLCATPLQLAKDLFSGRSY